MFATEVDDPFLSEVTTKDGSIGPETQVDMAVVVETILQPKQNRSKECAIAAVWKITAPNPVIFLMKLRQSLSYMGVDLEAGFKKKQHYTSKRSYNKNRSYVRLLMNANFIPFNAADEDIYMDIVDGNYTTFSPDILSFVEWDDNGSVEK